MKPTLILFCALIASAGTASAKPKYPPEMPDAREVVYKTASETKLKLWIFEPKDHQATDKRPAVVFFFGGGWRSGTPSQFEKQCQYLASRGMVAMTADYRVATRQQTKATACVEDGKSAVRWIRANAKKLGVDPNRIAAGGGSAGGHVAASTGMVPGFEAKGEDHDISSVPDALLLFNPAVVLAKVPGKFEFPAEKAALFKERMGVEPSELSPYHQVRNGLPPTIIFHGTNDSAVPFRTVELLEQRMKDEGNTCKLVGYEGQPHGFFNWRRARNSPFRNTMFSCDRFLEKLGWLEGKPTIEAFIKGQAN
ncbi:MAG: alpha/beta hydrolase [Opitutales bacterium]